MEISFKPETLFILGNFSLTNSFLTSILTTLSLITLLFLATRSLRLVPNLSQNMIETVLETLYNLNFQLAGERISKIFPWFATFFFFILGANLLGLFPGFGTVGFYHLKEGNKVLVPFLRSVNSDLNMTFALALVSLVAPHVLSVKILGIKEYLGRFFSLNPVALFVGLLEIVSEITKLFSLSFRLFGNIFAGEAVLVTISRLFAFILPLPFMMLEIVVGFVQALIFAMLTMVFMVILTVPHSAEHQEVETSRRRR